MKKLWRSGMIDKKVLREREQTEYINKLERVILELTREEKEPKYAIVHTSDNRSHKVKIADDYDEVRIGDNVILDFGGERIIAAPKERLKDNAHYVSHSYNRKTTRENINDWLFEQMRNRSEYNTFKGED